MAKLRVEKKATKIEEKDPDEWEDWPKDTPDGTRHAKPPLRMIPQSELIITDTAGKKETFHLTASSTYKRDGDWVRVIGNEGSSETIAREGKKGRRGRETTGSA